MKYLNSIFGLLFLFLIACQTPTKKNNTKDEIILFKDMAGNTILKEDLEHVTGQVNYEIMGTQNIDEEAKKLHEQARLFGESDKYDLAIENLQKAIKIDPNWVYPVYDLAFTYLLKGDDENALKYYQLTDQLAPKGFFTSKTALSTLEGEKSGKYPKGLYLNYLQIEWTNDVNKKMAIVKSITENVPDFAPAWKDLANLQSDTIERQKAIEIGLSKNPDAETKGILIINKAILLNEKGESGQAIQLLGNLIFSKDATSGNIELAKYVLKSFIEK